MKKIFIMFVLLFICISLSGENIPDIWPIENRDGIVSSPFGFRKEGYGGQAGFHKGIDISVPTGTKVLATMDGVVIDHWPPPNGFYSGHEIFGGCITIINDSGIVTFFAHLSKSFVHEGEEINRGQIIGEVGNTGWSTGPHLHYEIWVDPLLLMNEDANSVFNK